MGPPAASGTAGPIIRRASTEDADACATLALEPPGGLHDIVRDASARLGVARRTFLARGTGFGWDRTLVADDGGRVVGMVARFRGDEWPRVRMRTGAVMLAAVGPRYAVPLIRRGRAEERAMAPIPSDAMYVMSLAVAPDRRGRGVGVRLLDQVCEEASLASLRAVALDVLAENRRATAFYLRERFVVRGTRFPDRSVLRLERPVERAGG